LGTSGLRSQKYVSNAYEAMTLCCYTNLYIIWWSYCHIGMTMSYVCLSVCDAVHCGCILQQKCL